MGKLYCKISVGHLDRCDIKDWETIGVTVPQLVLRNDQKQQWSMKEMKRNLNWIQWRNFDLSRTKIGRRLGVSVFNRNGDEFLSGVNLWRKFFQNNANWMFAQHGAKNIVLVDLLFRHSWLRYRNSNQNNFSCKVTLSWDHKFDLGEEASRARSFRIPGKRCWTW